MAKAILIKAKERENKKPNSIRQNGFIPATLYGHGFSSKSIQVNTKDFLKIPHKAYSHINELEIEGREKYPVLIRNVQIDPVKDKFLNIEFYRIKSDEKIKVKVPLNFVGHSPAVVAGGVLIISYNEIDIQCFPKDIPDAIDVNLEEIKEIGQSIQAKDLKVSEVIQILAKQDELIAKVEIPKTHEVEEKAPEAVAGAEVTPEAGATPEAATGKEAAQATPKTPQAAKPPQEAKQPKK